MRATVLLATTMLVVHLAAFAAPSPFGGLSSTEEPNAPGSPHLHALTFGLCSGPQNAVDFPTSPVPVVKSTCEFSQTYKSTSPTASYGDAICGGYAVAFGPKGDLKRDWKTISLSADWGDAPLTAATCATAHVSAAFWGYRCDDAACSAGGWERVGAFQNRHGTWNTASQVCYIGLGANAGHKDYQTVSVDVIATQGQGRSAVRKRASVAMSMTRPTGACLGASAPLK